MAFLFYHMPSGLSLYFMASTALGLLERWLIDKQAAKIELKPLAETTARPKRAPGSPQASGKTWLDKLTDLQERMQGQRRTNGKKPKR
jgi:membrane protein insertase Oxa1/YidC/SpoIIIJ